jgi:hypothetical protein
VQLGIYTKEFPAEKKITFLMAATARKNESAMLRLGMAWRQNPVFVMAF